ncbi:MAG: hypothetical protein GXO15_01610, partial [Crenarchaeota archaeon]|nr:hypothetical protein [Thermoproteota archaeon]
MRRAGAGALPPLLLAAALVAAVAAAVGQWELVSYSWSGPGPGGEALPGGEASLSVSLRYLGGGVAGNVSVCVSLPQGFTLAPGEAPCSLAGDVAGGGVASASWRVLVGSSVSPGVYTAAVTVYYSVNGSAASESFTVELEVAEPPRPALEVVEAYWDTGGYPGSRGTLVLVFENRGGVDVSGGVLTVTLPRVFEPSEARVELPPVPAGGLARVELGVAVDRGAAPGVYRGSWSGVVSASAGGVSYTAEVSGGFSVEVLPAPGDVVSLVGYGFEPGEAAAAGGGGSRLYALLRVERPGAVVRAVYAWFELLEGGVFVNGSRTGFAFYGAPVEYGGLVPLESPPLARVEGRVILVLRVEALVEEGGSLYWVEGSWRLSVEPSASRLVRVRAYWAEGSVYPGSRGTLVLVVENPGPGSLEADLVLRLPEGFEPRVLHAGPIVVAGGGAGEARVEVSVSRGVAPGVYPVECRLEGIVSQGSAAAPVNESCRLLLRVERPPGWGLELVYAGWGFGDEAPPLVRG